MTISPVVLFEFLVNPIQLFLLVRRKMLFHIRNGLVENHIHLAPVFLAKGTERLCSTVRDLFDCCSLLFGQVDFMGEMKKEHLPEMGTLSGKDLRNPVTQIQTGTHTTDQYTGGEDNKQPQPDLPFTHFITPSFQFQNICEESRPDGSSVSRANRSCSIPGTDVYK